MLSDLVSRKGMMTEKINYLGMSLEEVGGFVHLNV